MEGTYLSFYVVDFFREETQRVARKSHKVLQSKLAIFVISFRIWTPHAKETITDRSIVVSLWKMLFEVHYRVHQEWYPLV